MSDIAVRVENLGKMYRIGAAEKQSQGVWETTKNLALSPFAYLRRIWKPATEEEILWALRHVSFEVKRGEVVGVIGRNGAGKSTLLKVLTRITEPTEGQAILKGRVGSLLEVGTGFHPELTGRENVYLSGTILGMRKADVDRKFDEIVDFSGVEKFIDTPVKRYSSGMKVRLGFAVAAHLEPEILLIDEVLAVGDAEFQKRCLGKMENVAQSGRTVLFVSHQMAAIKSLCSRTILIKNGTVTFDGESVDAIEKYLSIDQHSFSIPLRQRTNRSGNSSVKATELRIGTDGFDNNNFWITGQDAMVEIDYECVNDQSGYLEVALGVRKPDQTRMLYLGTKVMHQDARITTETGTFVCRIPRLPLEPGRYLLNTEFKKDGIIVDYVEGAAYVDVVEGDYYGSGVIWRYGGFLCDYSWSHHPHSSEHNSENSSV